MAPSPRGGKEGADSGALAPVLPFRLLQQHRSSVSPKMLTPCLISSTRKNKEAARIQNEARRVKVREKDKLERCCARNARAESERGR
ncbi:hypothetical protein COCC4DRAFT_126302 [Bipolaris maydis ATCC 48331]|uniref:Uncharacterized protein n=2 Tax=Cochliobolus heterostrophus TaxID=5016 RepID=M2UQ21_COCH5|nr:uncharacterized protein COCC4DRAFT_126302 [Bipolaris maydis ATCC 48331]EMD89987.1 hypothetical protein COCHEDRAFT_1022117 [Bipolaris maydis C5]ENI09800.1 hypothetical protein COCC4DRAFT_126302 [Bipolaris maydis ATCC 48331]